MPLLLVILSFSSVGSGVSFLIVEVDVDRLPRGFFKGPKWVSLNSVNRQFSRVEPHGCCDLLLVRFHDMFPLLKRLRCVQKVFCVLQALDGGEGVRGGRGGVLRKGKQRKVVRGILMLNAAESETGSVPCVLEAGG